MSNTSKKSYSQFELFTVGGAALSGLFNGLIAGWHTDFSHPIAHVLVTLFCGLFGSIFAIVLTSWVLIPILVAIGKMVLRADCNEDSPEQTQSKWTNKQ